MSLLVAQLIQREYGPFGHLHDGNDDAHHDKRNNQRIKHPAENGMSSHEMIANVQDAAEHRERDEQHDTCDDYVCAGFRRAEGFRISSERSRCSDGGVLTLRKERLLVFRFEIFPIGERQLVRGPIAHARPLPAWLSNVAMVLFARAAGTYHRPSS